MLSAEYSERGLTHTIKHYVMKIPDICDKLKGLNKRDQNLQTTIMDTVRLLMMDEFEIINWVKFIDRFEFNEQSYSICLFFIGLATKLLLNPQKVKEPFEVYLTLQNPNFSQFNHWVTQHNWLFYQDFRDAVSCHKIYLKLRKGLLPPFDYQ